jgi:hypothetical protein
MLVSRAVALLSILFVTAGTAFAQDQTQSSQQGDQQGQGHHGQGFHGACAADMKTYCASAQSREDRHQCLQTNRDKLSDGCKSMLDSHEHHRSDQ